MPSGIAESKFFTVLFLMPMALVRFATTNLYDSVILWIAECAFSAILHYTPVAAYDILGCCCDVWYLEPQNLKPGETPIEFAERVRDIISVRAGLRKVPWDGYLKYSRPSPKHRERKQQSFAESILRRLEEK
ncbi:UNVERIFIED_CONTAM: Glycerol-3-phosphate acyltransferase 9 [Sesamum angustifolium]|uniref:Glycerol-3-phosphate acyltransferase 9 n=1 Tax=Sesamum angustifolium TaxID=2727405 RepID=A0AAW2NY48_9LAMI